jgi:hypothetical protein
MIKIEVTGDTAEQVFAQLRGLIGQRDVVSGDVAITVRGATFEEAAAPAEDKPKRTRKPVEKVEEGNDAGAGASTEDTAAASSEATTTGTSTETAPVVADLDFDTDVAPKVLGAVQKHGKLAVEAVLAEFGVERASQLEANRWPELIEKLGDL